jgi:hypothetical protein
MLAFKKLFIFDKACSSISVRSIYRYLRKVKLLKAYQFTQYLIKQVGSQRAQTTKTKQDRQADEAVRLTKQAG